MKRFLTLAVLCCALGGCAIPLAVTVASAIIQVAITASTGKGVTDHILSAATMKDCVLFRVVQGDEVCIDTPEQALMQRPDGVYMRIDNADGTHEIAKVTQIQPVHSYNDMPHDTDAQSVIDAIRGPQPATTSGVVSNSAGNLPLVQ